MKRIMCYCLAISMIQHGSSKIDCTEPQLLLKETYCGYDNLTSLTMYTFNENFKVNVAETFTDEGCNIDFNEPYLNGTFYIECEIAETDCFDDDLKVEEMKSDTYYLECEDIDLLINDTTDTFEINDTNNSTLEIYTFRNETTTDFAVGINATVAIDAIFSHDNTVTTDSWSTFDVSESESTTSETNVFRNKTTTDLAIVLKDATVNSSDAKIFSSKNPVTTDNWLTFDVFESGNTTSETDVFRNETTTDLATVSTHGLFSDNTTVTDNWSTSAGFDVLNNETSDYVFKEVTEDPSESRKMLLILGYTAAALAAMVGMAFATYKLRSLMQSGRYRLPDTPNPPGFIELA